MKFAYLALALLGTVVPYIFFIQQFMQPDSGIGDFISGLFANGAAGGFSADVVISSLVFWIYLWQRSASSIWVYVLLNLTVGLSCALPVYLFNETRRSEIRERLRDGG